MFPTKKTHENRANKQTYRGDFEIPDSKDSIIFDTIRTVSTVVFVGKVNRSKPLLISLTSERT